MSEAKFRVATTSRFGRLASRLNRRHPGEFADRLEEAILILSADPQNTSRAYPIKKLVDVKDAQYRLRLCRFRYDIEGKTVYLKRCALRDRSTYKR